MGNGTKNFQEQKIFLVVRELNISQERVVEFLESEGYEDALSGSGLAAEIVDEEAYLALREEYADDAEAAARIRELRTQEDKEGVEGDEVTTLEEQTPGTGKNFSPSSVDTDPADEEDTDNEERGGNGEQEEMTSSKEATKISNNKMEDIKEEIERIDEKVNTTRNFGYDLADRIGLLEDELESIKSGKKEKDDVSSREEKDIEREIKHLRNKVKDIEEESEKNVVGSRKNTFSGGGLDNIKSIPDKTLRNDIHVVDYVHRYCKEDGIHMSKKKIANFYSCLMTDYLVILAGISGVGKSKLCEAFTEAIGGVYTHIPVRPNWTDEHDLLGFYDPRTYEYNSTRFLERLRKASMYEDRLFVFCLDEMNLSKPEHYFARFLSQMEKEEPSIQPDESLTLEEVSRVEEMISAKDTSSNGDGGVDSGSIEEMRGKLETLMEYVNVPIPSNVRFIGTVNMDSTTKGLSDKILDRSSVIQFDDMDLRNIVEVKKESQGMDEVPPRFVSVDRLFGKKDEYQEEEEKLEVESYLEDVFKINDLLSNCGLNFGFRTVESIADGLQSIVRCGSHKYIGEREQEWKKKCMDIQIKQRILPKVRSKRTDGLDKTINEFEKALSGEEYTESEEQKELKHTYKESMKKISKIKNQLDRGYINYWEA